MNFLLPRFAVCLMAGFALAVTGCAESKLPVYPVRGQVLSKGKPVAGAKVLLHPNFPAPDWPHQPLATTNDDGRFSLSTVGSNDGAPPGEYRVTVDQKAETLIGEELVREGRSLLPAKYRDADTTPLKITVQEGDNELAPFEIVP